MTTIITKSIRISDEENKTLRDISQREGVSESALLKQFVREGMAAYRLEQAITAYERGEADLSAAAQFAGVSVYQMMSELSRRDIALPAEAEKFRQGLTALVEAFGGSDALRSTLHKS